jgi:flavin-binding protein dodecin
VYAFFKRIVAFKCDGITHGLGRKQEMSIARVTEISSTSKKSFEDAIQQGIKRATKTLRNLKSAWIKEQTVEISNGKPSGYRVNMMITFVLDDKSDGN